MYSVVHSATLHGIDSVMVHVEADVCEGLPMFDMVGILGSEVKESRERIRAAIRNTGYRLPPKKITVNICPADLKKSGTGLDLPIALAVLSAYGLVCEDALRQTVFVGEIALNGEIRSVNGILPMALEAARAGFLRIVIPWENRRETSFVNHIQILPVKSLAEVIGWTEGIDLPERTDINIEETGDMQQEVDFCQIRGQKLLRRACEVAAAGRHNLLISGPPGAGKTMAAKALPGILPDLTEEEQMELAQIYSVSGRMPDGTKEKMRRPFRCPHHSITRTALIGGGRIPQLGEITLAHKGILFLDELTEYQKPVLEQLRQPLEEHQIRLVRLSGAYTYPADFMLVAAMNPCNCGFYPDRNKCVCTPVSISQHLQKVSRPLLDRIDITIDAPRIRMEELSAKENVESSAEIRKRVTKVHHLQQERYRRYGFFYNSQIPSDRIEMFCNMTEAALKIANRAYEDLTMSARSYHRLIRVARTVADLDESDCIEEKHMMEALLYRNLGDSLWRERP